MAKETILNRAACPPSIAFCLLLRSAQSVFQPTIRNFHGENRGTQGHPRAFNAVWFCLCATVDHRCGDGEQGLRHPGERSKKCRRSEPKNWSLDSRFARNHERARRPRIAEKSGEKYALTPESDAFLVSNKPGTLAGFFSMNRMRMMQHWMKLDEIVCTGRPAEARNQEGPWTEFSSELVENIIPMTTVPHRHWPSI